MPKHSHVQTEQTSRNISANQIEAIERLTSSLSQADAVVRLLIEIGERNGPNHPLSHKPVHDALWFVLEQIFRASTAVDMIGDGGEA